MKIRKLNVKSIIQHKYMYMIARYVMYNDIIQLFQIPNTKSNNLSYGWYTCRVLII